MLYLNADIKKLQGAFRGASRHLGKSIKGNDAYNYQVDFMYLLNDIIQGPEASARRAISEANSLINTILESKSE